MSEIKLPEKSIIVISGALLLIVLNLYILTQHSHFSVFLVIIALLVSGFLSDAFTGVAHFGFDYVLPYSLPILGPVAFEFNQHHDEPSLDPSSYGPNLTKGGYVSIPLSILLLILTIMTPKTHFWFWVEATFAGTTAWALFFHQIHAYAHMGSRLPPHVFKGKVEEIARLETKREQRLALAKLFETVPIPAPIRLLQRCGLILSPEKHNLHHIHFESNFSSINGWSDPLLNPLLRPVARRYKASRLRDDLTTNPTRKSLWT
ncbi:fatty acid desaturase CarF family protein [Microvirga zambiensis]|uniref:fatty acid desaturase CarF family protein n=1 Tax=Microvirga zambiensis TaxID=1402137 RepID=UPI00191DA21C|nr:fatty acid desaturase CarF family protein [Microvirga zambiensis]